jgi:hypothetical protein
MNEHHCCPLEDKKLRWRRITANVAKPKKIEDDLDQPLVRKKPGRLAEFVRAQR